MVAFQWRYMGVTADFLLPHDLNHVLRIDFDRQCIIRILDEMPLSCEEDGPISGLVMNHLAYCVQDSRFAEAQSVAWKDVFGPMIHHRFITGATCLDVLSPVHPTFAVVGRGG